MVGPYSNRSNALDVHGLHNLNSPNDLTSHFMKARAITREAHSMRYEKNKVMSPDL